ncbi:ABC transporter permease [Mesorhizobium xinjiangense]|uniref:ABC transporter permease n=1 Tax=Mesorhizobium xinjiangense TaxID=2678685 RepID=UPI0018DC94F2|nr:ABC transporter permease [Mesorhizobium xinjiangense]
MTQARNVDTGKAMRMGGGMALSKGFVTIVVSTIALIVLCFIFAPSAVTAGSLMGSLPFAAVLAIVGLGQMLVVQQGGFDLSVPGGVSLAVVIATHTANGNDTLLLNAVLFAFGCALLAGVLNGLMVAIFKLNAIVATIGMNTLLFGAVFAVSGGVPRITTDLLAEIAGARTFGIPNSVFFGLAILTLVSFVMKRTVAGRRFEAIGANPQMARTVGLRVEVYEGMAYVMAQLLYCTAGILIAGITREPTAFQGNSLLLPSVAVVALAGVSLLGGRGFPISVVVAAFFLNQLSQFALSIGIPYSAQTIVQALALVFGIGVYSIDWAGRFKNTNQRSTEEENHGNQTA